MSNAFATSVIKVKELEQINLCRKTEHFYQKIRSTRFSVFVQTSEHDFTANDDIRSCRTLSKVSQKKEVSVVLEKMPSSW